MQEITEYTFTIDEYLKSLLNKKANCVTITAVGADAAIKLIKRMLKASLDLYKSL